MTKKATAEKGKVMRAAEAIKYQSGAVVSRTLIDKDEGTVTLFAFDAGEGLSEHTAPYDALVHVIDGTVEISISGKKHVLTAGDLLIMPAGKPHALTATARMKMMLVMIRA